MRGARRRREGRMSELENPRKRLRDSRTRGTQAQRHCNSLNSGPRINSHLGEETMKIIGTINSQEAILEEISAQEIDFLAGKRIGTIEGRYDHIRAIPTGTTFNIVKAFDQIHRNNSVRVKSKVYALR